MVIDVFSHIENTYQEICDFAERTVVEETGGYCHWSQEARSDFRRHIMRIATQSSLITVITKTKLIDYALKTRSDGTRVDFRSDRYILQKVLVRIADFTSYTIELLKKFREFLLPDNSSFQYTLLRFLAESTDSHNRSRIPVRLLVDTRAARQWYFYKPVDASLYSIYAEFVSSFFYSYDIIIPQMYYSDQHCAITQFLTHHAQESDTDVRPARFYFYLGIQLAILYTLRATDMHMENIMACNNQPVVLDMETLCYRTEPDITWDIQYIGLVNDSGTSALLGGGRHRFIDFDVVLQDNEPAKPLVHTHKTQEWVQNRLLVSGELVPPLPYFESIVAGFREGYECVLHQKKHIVAWLAEKLTGTHYQVRHLIRPTYMYARELQMLDSPTSESRRKRENTLYHRLLAMPHLSHALGTSVVTAETADLMYGDVPYFYSYSHLCHLMHQGNVVYPGYFHSTLDAMMHRHILSNITPASLACQLNTLQTIQNSVQQRLYRKTESNG